MNDAALLLASASICAAMLALIWAKGLFTRHNLQRMSTYVRALRIAARFRRIWWQGSAYFENAANADELRRLLICSGPVFIKLGQIMCQRPDVFPEPFLRRLASLQRDAPQHAFATTRLEVLLALNIRRLDDVFLRFEQQPLASGSIAQVHEAVYKDGRRVAVKVRHPGIVQQVKDDLGLLRTIVDIGRRANNHYCRVIDVDRVMREMLAQCDMQHELRCLQTIATNFDNNPLIEFPKPIFANEAVLIESFVEGLDYGQIGDPQFDRFEYRNDAEREQARALCKQATLAAFLQMILHDALLHADLHRGNIMYRIERSDDEQQRLVPRVILIDFGIVVHLNDVQIEAIHELIVGLYQLHCQTVIGALSRVAMQNNALDNQRFRAFSDDCVKLVASVDQRRMEEGGINIARVMQELLVLLHRNRLLVDGNMIRVIVDFIMINEGRDNLDDDNLFDHTCKWVLQSVDGEHFALIIDHLVQFGMADFNRKAKISGRVTGDNGRASQAMALRRMSTARQVKYASVESLRGALSMRGESLTEAGSSMGVQQRAKLLQPRRRRQAASIAPLHHSMSADPLDADNDEAHEDNKQSVQAVSDDVKCRSDMQEQRSAVV